MLLIFLNLFHYDIDLIFNVFQGCLKTGGARGATFFCRLVNPIKTVGEQIMPTNLPPAPPIFFTFRHPWTLSSRFVCFRKNVKSLSELSTRDSKKSIMLQARRKFFKSRWDKSMLWAWSVHFTDWNWKKYVTYPHCPHMVRRACIWSNQFWLIKVKITLMIFQILGSTLKYTHTQYCFIRNISMRNSNKRACSTAFQLFISQWRIFYMKVLCDEKNCPEQFWIAEHKFYLLKNRAYVCTLERGCVY